MKKTWRSLLSATLVASMILSMILVSGLTFTASALAGLSGGVAGTDYDEVLVTEVAYGTGSNFTACDIVGGTGNAAHPNPWQLVLRAKTAGAAYARVDFYNIKSYPYVMISVNPDKTTVNAYTFMGQSNLMTTGQYNYITKPTAAAGSEIYSTFVANPQTHIVDLRTIPGNENADRYSIYIMLDGNVGDVFYINSILQFNGNVGVTQDLPLVQFAPANTQHDINYSSANGGKGFETTVGTFVDNGFAGIAQTSFWVSAAELAARPYLVLELKPDTAAQFSDAVIYDSAGANPINISASELSALKTVDLTQFLSTGCWIHLFYHTTVNFTPCQFAQAYLTAFNGNALPTYYTANTPIFSIPATTAQNIDSFTLYGSNSALYGFSTIAQAGQVGVAGVPITAERIRQTPYLVLQLAPDSVASYANVKVVTTDPNLGVATVSDYVLDPHGYIQIINLRNLNAGNDVWLQISTAAAAKGIVNLTQAYLTALPGFAANVATAGDELLSTKTTLEASISGTIGAYGTSNRGLSVDPPATVGDVVYYVYDIPAASVINTPFLVLQADTRFTSGLVAHLFYDDATLGKEVVLTEFVLDGSVQIIPLRKYDLNNTRTLRIRLMSTGVIKFPLAYLTESPNDAAAANGVTPTYSIIADAQKPDYPVADSVPSNVTIHKLDKAGFALVDNGGTGDRVAYYILSKADVDANPYLIYKSRYSGSFDIQGVYGPGWWGNSTADNSLLHLDGSRHVLDLRTVPSYKADGTVWLQLGWVEAQQGPMLFDCLIMANTPDFDYNTIPVDANSTYIVHYEERGGDVELADSYIKKDGVITAENTKEGYDFLGWYIIDDGKKVDAPAVTADMTVYAKYTIAGEFSGKTSPVYAQLQNGVTSGSATAKIRFVMAIKKAQLYEYDEVGFIISTKNPIPEENQTGSIVRATNTVYTSIIADENRVTAQQLGGDYICALTLANIKNANFDSNIYVRTVAKKDGEVVYMSNVRTYTVNGMLIGQV